MLALAIAPACNASQSSSDGSVAFDVRDVPWIHPDAGVDDATTDTRLQDYVTDAIRGEGIPCKLTIRGVNGTATPAWHDPNDIGGDQLGVWLDEENWALGSGRWVLMARGRARIALPPGDYELRVTRGAEYALLDLGTVTLTADHGAVVRGDLRRVVDTEGEVAGEFHVHSAPSFDSDVPLDQRILSLAVEGVEVFASTDHDALGDFRPAIAQLGLESWIHWIPGDEITADGFGHFGAYPLPPGVDPSVDLTHDEPSVSGIIARARGVAPNAVIQLNHPLWNDNPIGYWSIAGFDPATGMSMMQLFTAFDAVEVWNSHTLDEGPGYVSPDGVIDAWMSMLQLGRGATAMGNTDTHRLAQSPPGWPRTYLRVPDDDPANVTDAMVTSAILAGDAMVTSGPFVRATIDGMRPGTLVRANGGSVTVHIELQSVAWAPVDRIEVIVDRELVAVRDVTAPPDDGVRRQMWDVPVSVTRDAWVVARTRAIDPLSDVAGVHARPLESLALVNPIYVDTNGDGQWTPPGIGNGP
jgi:hypothetical protein